MRKSLICLALWCTTQLIGLDRDEQRAALARYWFHGHERVLHIGCGDGTISSEIALEVPDGFVLGLDNDVELPSQRFDPELFANLQFTSDTTLTTKFDLVVALGVDIDFDKVIQLLRPSGQLMLTGDMETLSAMPLLDCTLIDLVRLNDETYAVVILKQ